MGCFNVSCALSGLTIHAGDPCYFIPLVPDDFTKGNVGGDVLVVSNEGSNAIYRPAFLPIKGNYNDYGRLENPEENANTKHIEKMMGCSIEQFIDNPSEYFLSLKQFVYVHPDEKEEKGDSHYETVDVHIAGCFIHQFAYETAYNHTLNDESSFANSFPVSNFLLEYIGL